MKLLNCSFYLLFISTIFIYCYHLGAKFEITNQQARSYGYTKGIVEALKLDNSPNTCNADGKLFELYSYNNNFYLYTSVSEFLIKPTIIRYARNKQWITYIGDDKQEQIFLTMRYKPDNSQTCSVLAIPNNKKTQIFSADGIITNQFIDY